jgi:hypothetical protein
MIAKAAFALIFSFMLASASAASLMDWLSSNPFLNFVVAGAVGLALFCGAVLAARRLRDAKERSGRSLQHSPEPEGVLMAGASGFMGVAILLWVVPRLFSGTESIGGMEFVAIAVGLFLFVGAILDFRKYTAG